MKILLIGRSGQVAWELQRSLACVGEVIAVDRHSQPLAIDLEDADGIRRVVREIEPQLIVNAAGYTEVDKAEEETERAHRINAVAPGILAESAAEIDAGLVHYSTDYVFPGDASAPYSEESTIGPHSVYGATKLQGDLAIEQAGIPHLILCTAWVYGARGSNFLLTMLRLMRERDALKVVDDQIGAPTWSRQIAECTALIIAQCRSDGRFQPEQRSGTYHLTCAGQTSWYGFAERIRATARELGILDVGSAEVRPIATTDYPTPAKRPAYSVLSNQKLKNCFRLALPAWEDALEQCLADYAEYRTER
jgi:dTDP-4-dehydrorhamnose reductase